MLAQTIKTLMIPTVLLSSVRRFAPGFASVAISLLRKETGIYFSFSHPFSVPSTSDFRHQQLVEFRQESRRKFQRHSIVNFLSFLLKKHENTNNIHNENLLTF